MTRVLEIVGTGIRREIEDCDDCPCLDDERGTCDLTNEWVGVPALDSNGPVPENCPLPEKP